MNATFESTTIDFSCVTGNFGLLSITSTPADNSAALVALFSPVPSRRIGFSITRTLTPRSCAAITALRMAGSEKMNILIRSDFLALAMALRNALGESSGRTIKCRDIAERSPLGVGRCCLQRPLRPQHGRAFMQRRIGELRPVHLRVQTVYRHQFVVRTLLRHHAVLENHYFVRVANRRQAVGDHDHGAIFHQLLESFNYGALRFAVERGGRRAIKSSYCARTRARCRCAGAGRRKAPARLRQPWCRIRQTFSE